MTAPRPGNRDRIYMGSWQLACSVAAYQEEWVPFSDERILSDGTGYAAQTELFSGCCDRPEKGVWTISLKPRPKLGSLDLERLLILEAINDTPASTDEIPGFDFCPWRPKSEGWFIRTGDTAAGTLMRRNSLDVITDPDMLPDDASARFTPYHLAGLSAGSGALGAIDTATYRQAWTSGTANNHNTWIYWPVYRVRISGTVKVTVDKMMETRTYRLVEI